MKLYCKNEKPFVYTVFSGDDSGRAIPILRKINEEGIAFWYADRFSKKENKRIEAAYACVLFISNNAIHDENVLRYIQYAVKHNKKILCIYLEPTPLSPGLELLLNSLQSIGKGNFSDDQAFTEKLKSAAVFNDMKITAAQKRFAKRRALASVFIPIASAVAIFFAVVVPMLIAPAVLAANGALSKVGFGNLSLAELAKVEELYVIGTQSFDYWYLANYVDETNQEEVFLSAIETSLPTDIDTLPTGDISDISDLALLKNAKAVAFQANQVSDISPLYNIKTLEHLTLNCNPIKSLDGIETLQNLKSVSLICTEVSDISPLFKIPSIELITFYDTYVNSIEGIENLPHLLFLFTGDSNLTDISPLNKIDFSYINDTDGFTFEASGEVSIQDYSPLQRIPKFREVSVCVRRLDDILPYISNKQVSFLCMVGSDINSVDSLSSIQGMQHLCLTDSQQLITLDGIEDFTELGDIEIADCGNIADYTQLLQLSNLERLIITSDMKERALAQLAEADFEIIIEDE